MRVKKGAEKNFSQCSTAKENRDKLIKKKRTPKEETTNKQYNVKQKQKIQSRGNV